jgi:hypothetical protein
MVAGLLHQVEADDEAGFREEVTLRILVCPACDTAYFQEEYWCDGGWMDAPEMTHWPPPARRPRPPWFNRMVLTDGTLERILREVYTALDSDLRILAAIGIRTAFDRAAELLKIDVQAFGAKLTALVDRGAIGVAERQHLDVLVDAGGAAAHRGWNPDHQQLTTMMDIIEGFIHRSFILPGAAKRLREGVPARLARSGKPAASTTPGKPEGAS